MSREYMEYKPQEMRDLREKAKKEIEEAENIVYCAKNIIKALNRENQRRIQSAGGLTILGFPLKRKFECECPDYLEKHIDFDDESAFCPTCQGYLILPEETPMSQKTIEKIYKEILKIKKGYSWLGFTDSKVILLAQALVDKGLRFREVDEGKIHTTILIFISKYKDEHNGEYPTTDKIAHAIATELNKDE